jgi:hypothetical protein
LFEGHGFIPGSITLCGNLEEYADATKLNALLNKLYKTTWVVFSRQTFASPLRVIEYLGNYTHRVALAESRLVSHGQATVSFTYKDYADMCKKKYMALTTVEFIRRFLLHVLPAGFMRIRHYGYLSNSGRKKGLQRCADIFATLRQKREDAKNKVKQPWNSRVKEQTGFDPLLCKKCGKAVMVLIAEIAPVHGMLMACLTGP